MPPLSTELLPVVKCSPPVSTSQGLGVRSSVGTMLHCPCHCQRAPACALCAAAQSQLLQGMLKQDQE